MIEAIREIGEYSLKKARKSTDNPLEILINNPSNSQTKNIMFIRIDRNDEKYFYNGIELENFEPKKLIFYLYRKGSSRGTDITPTAMITNPTGTFRGKVLAWFKRNSEDKELLTKVGLLLNENEDLIIRDLKDKFTPENNIISLKINNKYLGEFEEFKNFLLEKAKTDYYYKNSFTTGKYSISKDELCSVCKKHKAEVYGFVSTFKFYTVDKPGFVSGGFRQGNAWKNYPVCLECALILEEGKKYLGDHFNFNFYGSKYLLIPKFLVNTTEEDKKAVFRIFDIQNNPNFTKENVKRLTNDEKEILYLMSEFKNYINLNFLFYSAPKGYNGAVFNVLQYIEDILPSRIKHLFDAKRTIDKLSIFNEHLITIYENGKPIGEKPLEFNFGILRTFFYNSVENNPISDSYFLDSVNKIFSSRPIDYNFILSFIINKIRTDFANGYSTNSDTLKGFMLLLFLNRLKLINFSKGDNIMRNDLFNASGDVKEKIESFFNEFSDFFDSNEKKAVFLEGVLTQFLLNIQYADKNSQPFRARLKGLKMDKNLIVKLLPEIQNKLEEYGKNYYGQLEEEIATHFVLAGGNWNLSNDEISFYFVLGMNLSKYFKSEKENKKEGDNNE